MRFKDIKRLRQILDVLAKEELGYYITKLNLNQHLPWKTKFRKKSPKPDPHPARVRKIMENLGGTFVKLGQLLSLRPDLIPHEYCDEFRKLRDEVPPFSTAQARKMIEKELGKKLHEVFSSFSEKPIASASIAQVYVATLKNGNRVAVKIQRPNIGKLIDEDINIMMYLSQKIEKHIDPKIIKPTAIVDEFQRYTKQELDFVIEARNVEKFYKIFQNSHEVRIPKVYWEHTTEKVLTIEYIQGIRISDAKNLKSIDKKRIANITANAVFEQIFIHGFFHADPHPGNIFVVDPHTIAFLDFGIVGYLDDELKENMSSLFIGMIEKDLELLAESLIDLGFIEDGDVDIHELKQDLRDNLSKYYGTELRLINISELFHQLINVAKHNNIVLPPNFVLFSKAMVTLEGTEAELDPSFDLVKTARPFVKSLMKNRKNPKHIFRNMWGTTIKFKKFAHELPEQTRMIVAGVKKGDKIADSIEQDLRVLTHEVDKSSNRISYGVLIAGFVIAGALMFSSDQEQLYGMPIYSFVGFAIAILLLLVLLFSMFREK